MRWIKRFGVLLCFVIALSSPVLCQQNSYPLQTAATATGNGNPLPNNGQGGVTVQVAGTFVGTVTFEVTQDGTNYVAIQGKNITDATLSTTATAPGVFDFVLGGSDKFRARISAYTSGLITVTARLAQGVISQYEGGGSGSGTVTQVTGVDTNGFTFSIASPTTTPAITLDISALDAAKVANGSVSNAEFQRLDGVTSGIQSQIDGKQASLGFTAENVANKATGFGTLNNTLYPTTQAVANYAQPLSTNLTTFSAIAPSANVQTLLGAASFSAFRSSLGVAIGTDVLAPTGSGAGLSGVVTSVGVTSPITSTGGQTPTIACATCGVTGTGLNQFASTTSAQFLGIISNETGSGLVMGNDTPTIITPSFTTGFTIAGVAASRKIIVGNGTNFVASTETWAVPGTSGNVLTSDGTNWTSATPSGGGTTINSTNNVIPQRSNSTTFIDSPITGSVPGSMVDGITVTGAATASPATVTMAATGSDSNINIALVPKGTGLIGIGGSTSSFPALKQRPSTSQIEIITADNGGARGLLWLQSIYVQDTASVYNPAVYINSSSSTGRVTLASGNTSTFGWSNTSNDASQAVDTAFTRISAGLVGVGTGGGGSFAGSLKLTDIVQVGKITTYNNVATAGNGVSAIVAAGRVTAQSAANASIATYTVGAADSSFDISMNMNVTAATVLSTSLNCDYTDESNTARTMILPTTSLSGTFLSGGVVTGTGAFETPVMHLRCKAGTTVTLYTATGTFTGITYTAEGNIKQTK